MNHLWRHRQTFRPLGTVLVTGEKLTECSGVLSSPIHLLCISLWLFKLLKNQDNLLFQDQN